MTSILCFNNLYIHQNTYIAIILLNENIFVWGNIHLLEMASTSTFSLFPSASIKKESSKTKRSMPSLRIPNKEPDFEMVGLGGKNDPKTMLPENGATAESVNRSKPVLRVQVDKPPNLYIPKHPSRLSTPPETNDDRQQLQATSPGPNLPPSPPQSRPETPAATAETNNPAAPALVRNGSVRSTATATHSPVMRSMFPQYDPSVALSQQQYFPTIGRSRSGEPLSGMCNVNLYPPPRIAQSRLYQSRPAQVQQASLLDIAVDRPHNDLLSTPEELLDLWSISNGQGSQEAGATFSLDLSW